MPEQISKYPEVTLRVLKGAGARCGEGAKQQILKKCPPKQFCALPTGEICVYGIKDIPQMTQITKQELAQVVCPQKKSASIGSPSWLLFAFIGFVLGWVVSKGRLGFRFGGGPH